MSGFPSNYPRRSMSLSGSPLMKKKPPESVSSDAGSVRRAAITRSMTIGSERSVKRLRLSKALTMPDNTSVKEACRRMAVRRVDAVLLTDSNALLCGILTDKDVALRVIACELSLEETPVSKVMTRNPIFVLSDTLAEEALQKMVTGKFRHLPVVENGEVIALLDIKKCLYDAIARMERTAEKGKAIQAAIEGVEKSWGTSVGANTFVGTLRDRVFRPSLSTILSGNSKAVTVEPTETVLDATKKMVELQRSSAIITLDNKPLGIMTSRDILMRVVAKNLPPDTTSVDKVMTSNPECGTTDTSILDALQIMQSGKFLHLPVLDRVGGNLVLVIDVFSITHAAVATVESSGTAGNEAAISLMQKFWDSAMAAGPSEDDDDETRSNVSLKIASEALEALHSPRPMTASEAFEVLHSPRHTTASEAFEVLHSPRHTTASEAFEVLNSPRHTTVSDAFTFKLEDKRGRMHRFTCDTRSFTCLITCILKRTADDIDRNNLPQILYEDEDNDRVVLASDSDLVAAVEHAKLLGWKGLRLHLDYSREGRKRRARRTASMDLRNLDAWTAGYSAVAAGAALVAGLGMMAYLMSKKIA